MAGQEPPSPCLRPPRRRSPTRGHFWSKGTCAGSVAPPGAGQDPSPCSGPQRLLLQGGNRAGTHHRQLLLYVTRGVKSQSPRHAAVEQSRNFGSPTSPCHTGSPQEGASGFDQPYFGRSSAGCAGSSEHPCQAGVTEQSQGAVLHAMAPAYPRERARAVQQEARLLLPLPYPCGREGRPGPLAPGSGSLLHWASSVSGKWNFPTAGAREEWGAHAR